MALNVLMEEPMAHNNYLDAILITSALVFPRVSNVVLKMKMGL